MKQDRVNNFPRTVEKALTLLEHIAKAERPLGISEISNDLDINKSTVYRILQSLRAKDYIDQDSVSNKYRIGFKILELNTAIVRNIGFRKVAVGHMEKLAQETLETVGLAMMDRDGVIYLDQAGGEEESIRIHFRIGLHMPFHCTGTGKAMLAFLDDGALDDILARHELNAYTANTITDPNVLREELKKIREDGYALNNGEYQEVVRTVAAPIFDSSNKVVGSIAVAGLKFRFKLEIIPRFGELVKMTAAEISRNLGCNSDYYNSRKYR